MRQSYFLFSLPIYSLPFIFNVLNWYQYYILKYSNLFRISIPAGISYFLRDIATGNI
jgi:hypothetical protein